jgi:hypothetical protein
MSKILLKKVGANFKPYVDIKDAEKELEKLKINGEVIDIDGGYAILKLGERAPTKTRYFKCTIAPRSNPEDLDTVPLGHNGYIINVRRGEDVILPETHIGVAKDAVRTEYDIKDTVTISKGKVAACPIMVGEEVSREEWEKEISQGNDIRNAEAKDRLRRLND